MRKRVRRALSRRIFLVARRATSACFRSALFTLLGALSVPGCTPTLSPELRPRAIVVLPPDSVHLDPLVTDGKSTVREPDRKLMVEVVESVLPLEVKDRLADRGVRAVVLRPVELAGVAGDDLETLESALTYASLARAHDADRVLRLGYDGSIHRGSGSVDMLGGLMAVDFPSDTTWYELRIQATMVDPANAENTQTFEVSGKAHTEILSLLGGATEHDRLAGLTRDLTAEIVRRLLQAD